MVQQIAQYYRDQDMPMMFRPAHDNGNSDWALVFIFIVFTLVICLSIFITYKLATRSAMAVSENQDNNKDFLDIAKERYVRGEIDKAKYDEIKQALSSEPHTAHKNHDHSHTANDKEPKSPAD